MWNPPTRDVNHSLSPPITGIMCGDAKGMRPIRDCRASAAASETVNSVLGDMGQFMTGAPQTHSGTVDMSFGR